MFIEKNPKDECTRGGVHMRKYWIVSVTVPHHEVVLGTTEPGIWCRSRTSVIIAMEVRENGSMTHFAYC